MSQIRNIRQKIAVFCPLPTLTCSEIICSITGTVLYSVSIDGKRSLLLPYARIYEEMQQILNFSKYIGILWLIRIHANLYVVDHVGKKEKKYFYIMKIVYVFYHLFSLEHIADLVNDSIRNLKKDGKGGCPWSHLFPDP
jgi:hypothetical protein